MVELRFFGGLSVEETADVLKVSTETVKRDWRLAKSWLVRELTPGPTNESTDFTDCTEKKERTYAITGTAMEVHRQLGSGLQYTRFVF